MNKLDRQRKINENIRKIQTHKIDMNCIKISRANSFEHEMKKAEVCVRLNQQGFDFVTEAIFEKGRVDVYIPELDWAIEILKSETDKRFNAKNYPVKKVIKLRVDEDIEGLI